VNLADAISVAVRCPLTLRRWLANGEVDLRNLREMTVITPLQEPCPGARILDLRRAIVQPSHSWAQEPYRLGALDIGRIGAARPFMAGLRLVRARLAAPGRAHARRWGDRAPGGQGEDRATCGDL